MTITSGGKYILINGKTTERCLDLSGADDKSIIGYECHNGENQQWEFRDSGCGWVLKNVGRPGKYLGIDGHPANGTHLAAVDNEFMWHIHNEQDGKIRLFVPNTNFNADLADHGNPTPGTPIHLWDRSQGQNQVWIPRQA